MNAKYPLIFLGSDHGGRELRWQIRDRLISLGYPVDDSLSIDTEEMTDYPDVAHAVARAIQRNSGALGILLCGSGIGMSIAANRHAGIRAALCTTEYHAKLSRQHNFANVLCLGARLTGADLAWEIVDTFLHTAASSVERHERRVNKIDTEY